MFTYAFNQSEIATRATVEAFFEAIPTHIPIRIDLGNVQFMARNAAQEFVNRVNQRTNTGQRIEIVNTNNDVHHMLQVAVKPNTQWQWLLVGGALVAAGLLIAHISDPKAVKRALKEF